MISRNGVYYDLKASSFRYTKDGLTYVFSSRLHLKKFKEKLIPHRDTINASLSRRFNLFINVPHIADIVLYRKIETRGFLVIDSVGNELCQNNIKYDCGKVTLQKQNEA